MKWSDKFSLVSKKDQKIAIQPGTDGFTEFVNLNEGCRLVISAPVEMTSWDRFENNITVFSRFGAMAVALLGGLWMFARLFLH